MPGLGATFGRGAATTFQQDLAESDCILIMGSNMAEAHPVGFRWPLKAREKGATLIHVDPRFTRTSAMCDMYVPIRTGSDIAFLGGLIRYVLTEDRWFREYVRAYTNAATIISERYADADEADGLFAGFDKTTNEYDQASWQYDSEAGRDETFQHPRCVLNLVRQHFSRYTPEMVADVCGSSREDFLRVAKALSDNSGRDRTSAIVYAVGWTQHTTGVQTIRAAAILQLLLGNVGRPGGGIMAMRGHASIQGSTDIPTLYNLLPGYLPQPEADLDHTLADYLDRCTEKTGYWAHLPRFMVSLLKAWYGEHAREENDWGFGWIPKIDGDYSQLATAIQMLEGKVRGMFLFGQNPAAGAPNARLNRAALGKLDWLVVRDWFETESACFWKDGPENPDPTTIGTEIFFVPAAAAAEKEGSFTNTQRLIQWHDRALDPPGDCRSDAWFVIDLGRRLKELYRGSRKRRDQGLRHLTWDYPDNEAVLKEINGYTVADREQVAGFDKLADDGSTACGCWIYSGVFPSEGNNRARSRQPDPKSRTNPDWGFAWPANRRMLYNRASADPEGRPWSDRKKYVWWDEERSIWMGYDVPDFEISKAPSYRPARGATGMDAIAGDAPFIMKPDGRGWLFAPRGVVDGPLPAHYEPVESPIPNLLYSRQTNPLTDRREGEMNPTAEPMDADYPIVATTVRLTEHYLSGPMSRFNSWLNELQPEMFVEISGELASEYGIRHGGWMVVETLRGAIETRAMVTGRIRALTVGGARLPQIAIPFHWGYAGETTGAMANDLTSIVLEPNVGIHEAKSFACRVRPGRLTGTEERE